MSLLKTPKLLVVLITLLPIIVMGQTPLRIIDKASWRSEPIKIQKIKTGGKVIELGRRFPAEGDWLKGLTVTVENVSSKAIARIELILAFPRAHDPSQEAQVYVVRLMHGLDPSDPSYSETQKPTMPGETVEVTLPDANVPIIKADLKTLGYPDDTSRAQIRIDSVTFLDGSTWAGDEILYPDPKNPSRKINPKFQRQDSVPDRPLSYYAPLRIGPSDVQYQKANFTFGLPGDFYSNRFSLRSLLIFQDETLPCNTLFLGTENPECATGCTFKRNLFDDNIELLGLRDARKQLSPTRCQRSDGTFCNDTLISFIARAPCGVRIAGTCAAIADWTTYPSTGCITGLIFGGPCTRSNAFQNRCASPTGYDADFCNCPDGIDTSPIIIDIHGTGFSMSDAIGGVVFNILDDNVPVQLSWTAVGSTNAFLVLDRNGNGKIDSGAELFGNITPQPSSAEANGFIALAQYDKAENGGNGDGKIDRRDAIFNQLRLWQDLNHNGISESTELIPLAQQLRAIDLDYKESRRTDQYGNTFRYRAKVYNVNGVQAGRWAWDVFFKVL